MTDEESTGLPDIHKVRSIIMDDKDKMKPVESSEHHGEHIDNDKHHEHHENHEHGVNYRPPNHKPYGYQRREFDETTESNTEIPPSDVHTDLNKFLFTTMETKAEFEKKAIPSHELEKEEIEHTSTDKDVNIKKLFQLIKKKFLFF